jgi:hypothetical protein
LAGLSDAGGAIFLTIASKSPRFGTGIVWPAGVVCFGSSGLSGTGIRLAERYARTAAQRPQDAPLDDVPDHLHGLDTGPRGEHEPICGAVDQTRSE